MAKLNHHESREAWLKAATDGLRSHFETAGYPLPASIRFSIGFPSTGRKGKRIGECWNSTASDDQHFEIFIRADQSDAGMVLGILSHELTHAAVPLGSGHGKVFRKAALAIGLEGKMTQALPGPDFAAKLAKLADNIGPLPHARLNLDVRGDDAPKKQGTRLLKAECEAEGCGYTVRITKKWLDDVGAPCCPKHGAMTVDGWEPGGEDDEDGEE